MDRCICILPRGCWKAGIVKDNKEVFELSKIWIVKKEFDQELVDILR